MSLASVLARWFKVEPEITVDTIGVLRVSPDGDRYILTDDYTVPFGAGDPAFREFVTIPRGYVFDGASVPRMFWFVLGTPFDPVTMPFSAPHDRIYQTHERSRAVADALLREGLRLSYRRHYETLHDATHPYWFLPRSGTHACNVFRAELKAWTYWAGVRIGGRPHWNRTRSRSVPEEQPHG